MPREAASKNDPDTQIVNTKTRPRCAINMRRLVKRRREPHEIPSRTYAIYNQCRECRGWEGDGRSLADEVAACPNTDCLLWPVRSRNASKSPNIDHQAENRPNLPANNPDIDFGTIGRLERPIIDVLKQSHGRSRIITDFCAGCQCLKPGESRDPIQRCSSPQCWVYPWRTGKLDVDTYEPETLEDLERRVEAESREKGKTG